MDVGRGEDALTTSLRTVHVVASGVGIIVGAGIYVLLGPAAQEAGELVWLAFAVSAAICSLTALSYAELAGMFPRAGGEYEYASHVFGRRSTFVVGWTMTMGLVVAGATVALGFAEYTRYFWDVERRIPATIVIIGSAAVAVTGATRWSRVVVALSSIKVGGLLFVTVLGFGATARGSALESPPGSTMEVAGGVLAAAALVFFAFIGFDEVATLSEETADPTRTTPRALLWSLGISALLYVVVAVAAVRALGVEALANSPRPLTHIAATALGDGAGTTMAVLALVTTANTVILVLTAASRMVFAMGRRGDLPSRWARISDNGSPSTAVVAAAALMGAFALVGELKLIASATDVMIFAVFLSVNVMVIRLRRTAPDLPRAFRSPWTVAAWPVLPFAGLATTVGMALLLERTAALVGGALIAGGIVVAVVRKPGSAEGRGAGSDAERSSPLRPHDE